MAPLEDKESDRLGRRVSLSLGTIYPVVQRRLAKNAHRPPKASSLGSGNSTPTFSLPTAPEEERPTKQSRLNSASQATKLQSTTAGTGAISATFTRATAMPSPEEGGSRLAARISPLPALQLHGARTTCSMGGRRRAPPFTGLCRHLKLAPIYLATFALFSILTPTRQQAYDNRYRMGGGATDLLAMGRQQPSPGGPQMRSAQAERAAGAGSAAAAAAGSAQLWPGALVSDFRMERSQNGDENQGAQLIVRRTMGNSGGNKPTSNVNSGGLMKSVRHIVNGPPYKSGNSSALLAADAPSLPTDVANVDDACSDRLCYGLPAGCVLGVTGGMVGAMQSSAGAADPMLTTSSLCRVMVTAKRFIDPSRPVSRDILFELIASPEPNMSNYAAVGFSETGRMAGLVTECYQYRDPKSSMQVISLKHSFNIPGTYNNVPVDIISGIKRLGVFYESGYYQCRWIVESAVEFSFQSPDNGSIITKREDLGYKSYHILLATGEYDTANEAKMIHTERVSSMAPVSLAQTGHIKSLGSHILVRIHGSLMIVIWIGLVTLSIILARYYKNEWSNLKISESAIWFMFHRTLMLAAWFGTLIGIIFAFMYTETYHPGIHQISGTMCLVLATIQVLGGLFRPSQESSKRIYFNWTHFICGNLSYLLAMICLITAAFLAPAQLPPLYIWIMVIFVATYAIAHVTMTLHQYIVHKSSSKLNLDHIWLETFMPGHPLTPPGHLNTHKEISITPVNESATSSSTNNKMTSSGFMTDHSYPKETSSPFRQFMLGILVTIIVIFIVLLISLVNIK